MGQRDNTEVKTFALHMFMDMTMFPCDLPGMSPDRASP